MAADLVAKRDAMAQAFTHVADSLRAAAMAVDAFSLAMPENKGVAAAAANGVTGDKVKKEKKEKKVKDPNAPKPPVGAYLLYSGTVREKVRKENPTLSSHEVAALIGKMWNDAGEKDKTPYTSIYEADKARYKEQMKEYTDYIVEHGNSEGFTPSNATKPKAAVAAAVITAPTPDSDDESSDMEVTASLKAAPTPKSTKKAAATPVSSSKKRKDGEGTQTSAKKKVKKGTDAVKESEDTPSKKKKKDKK